MTREEAATLVKSTDDDLFGIRMMAFIMDHFDTQEETVAFCQGLKELADEGYSVTEMVEHLKEDITNRMGGAEDRAEEFLRKRFEAYTNKEVNFDNFKQLDEALGPYFPNEELLEEMDIDGSMKADDKLDPIYVQLTDHAGCLQFGDRCAGFDLFSENLMVFADANGVSLGIVPVQNISCIMPKSEFEVKRIDDANTVKNAMKELDEVLSF